MAMAMPNGGRAAMMPGMREKFDRQRYLLNVAAIWHADLGAIRRGVKRMAWIALDNAATAAGKAAISQLVWEVVLRQTPSPPTKGEAHFPGAVAWLRDALGVSRSGLHAWLNGVAFAGEGRSKPSERADVCRSSELRYTGFRPQ